VAGEVTTLQIRFATTNAPESAKRGLLRDRLARAVKVQRWATRHRIDVRVIQEAGTYAERVDIDTPARKVLWAKFNAFVKGRQIGNGIDVNRWRFKSRLLDDLTVGLGDGAVHLAVALVTHRRTGFTFKVYAVHKPTRRADNSSLRPVIDAALRERTRHDDKAGTPWIVAGDFNGPFDHGVELGDHGVDSIRASKHFEPLGQQVYDRPLLSDHDFLIADAAVEV
jgi:hypothetical protein